MKQVCALMCLSVFAAAASADPGARYALGAVSDFVWRGIAQTNTSDVAFQGEAAYEGARGFYVSAWGSTLDGTTYPIGGDADLRADFSAGVRAKTRIGLSFDLGATAVRFDESRLGFEETYLGIGFGQLYAKVAHDWDNDNTYTVTGVNIDIGSGVLFSAHLGHFNGETIDNYSDYGGGLSTTVQGWLLGLAITDTDISPANDTNNTHTVLSIKKQW